MIGAEPEIDMVTVPTPGPTVRGSTGPTSHPMPAPTAAVAPEADDATLLRLVAAGDRPSFEAFYRLHVDAVITSAARRCDDPHEVGDVVAETFLAVWRKAETFDPDRGSPRQWVAGISARAFLDLRRSERRRDRLRTRVSGRADLDLVDLDHLAEQIDAQRAADAIARAVAALPARQRLVFELVAVDGLDVGAVAASLGMAPAAVSMRLSRARKTLRLDGDLQRLVTLPADPAPTPTPTDDSLDRPTDTTNALPQNRNQP